MGRVRRDAVVIVLVALCGVATAFPPFSLLHGWSIDALTTLRWQAFGIRRDPASTPVAVIAIDEETYQTPVCAENLNADVAVMKSAEDGA
jgi:adenylate cyclase